MNLVNLEGLTTKDGKKIKKGSLYRSGIIEINDVNDLEEIRGLNIKYIFDLTGVKGSGIKADKHALERIFRNISVSTMDKCKSNINYYGESYKELTYDNIGLKEFFADLELIKDTPILIMGLEGTDRVGLTTALVLELLGVKREHILHNYVSVKKNSKIPLTKDTEISDANTLYKEYKDGVLGNDSWIISMLEDIDNTYGNIDNYMMEEYRYEEYQIKKLKRLFLEDID